VAVAMLAGGLDPKQVSGAAAAHTKTGNPRAARGAVPQLGLSSWLASAALFAARVITQGAPLTELRASRFVWLDTAYTAAYCSACRLLPQRWGIHTSLLPGVLQPGQLMLAAAAAEIPLLNRCTEAQGAAAAERHNKCKGGRAGGCT
jgi:hypothetical protein